MVHSWLFSVHEVHPWRINTSPSEEESVTPLGTVFLVLVQKFSFSSQTVGESLPTLYNPKDQKRVSQVDSLSNGSIIADTFLLYLCGPVPTLRRGVKGNPGPHTERDQERQDRSNIWKDGLARFNLWPLPTLKWIHILNYYSWNYRIREGILKTV